MREINVQVFQIPLSEEHISSQPWINLPFGSAHQEGFHFGGGAYERVYRETVEFAEQWNRYKQMSWIVEHIVPSAGRKISTSDVIAMDDDWYYVDEHGFVLFEPEI